MKTLSFYAVLLISIFSFNASIAQTAKTETIKVWGNCGMCKTTIEKAAKKAGATKASWNEDSKELKVTYAVNKTSSAKIQEAIANSGYDTQDFTAKASVYDKLPGCCKYDRKESGTVVVNPGLETATGNSYSCPMHPEITSDKPGKCSKCGMDLKEKEKNTVVYACPMKCEGDKTYDKAGKCPVCGMNLKEKQKATVVYSCPMKCEGDKTYEKAGKCPVCGMNLKEKEKATVVYSCPMKCEGDKTYDKAGKCPTCGMNLKEKKG